MANELTLQQRADHETLLLTFFRTLREAGGKTNHQPTAKQILFWVDMYGFACTEQGIQYGLPRFLKKMKDGVIRSDKDALYMVNYLNAVIKGKREDFENARTQPVEDQRT
jgi:hypothetical protein